MQDLARDGIDVSAEAFADLAARLVASGVKPDLVASAALATGIDRYAASIGPVAAGTLVIATAIQLLINEAAKLPAGERPFSVTSCAVSAAMTAAMLRGIDAREIATDALALAIGATERQCGAPETVLKLQAAIDVYRSSPAEVRH